MQPVGLIFMLCGGYTLYCAAKNLSPLTTAKQLMANPKSAGTILNAGAIAQQSSIANATNSVAVTGTGQANLASTATPKSGSASAQQAQSYAQSKLSTYGWGADQYQYLYQLWMRESGWNVNAYNASSGATGIPQSLPGSKMASAGSDWQSNYQTQINWGLGYIKGTYGSPQAAWAHEVSYGWY